MSGHAAGAKPRNIIVILTDDHRDDALGFMKSQAFLEAPQLDRLVAEGVHFKNAMVTTALCSPPRLLTRPVLRRPIKLWRTRPPESSVGHSDGAWIENGG